MTRHTLLLATIVTALLGSIPTLADVPKHADNQNFGTPQQLPRPSEMDRAEFEAVLFPFLKSRKYAELGWAKDKGVRDTGPYIDGTYYGTHPAVRVFYSPGVMKWLVGGRKGAIADGEMIIKEQYAPPATRYDGLNEQQLRDSLESWTVMIKDSRGSHDGWFWSNPGSDAEVPDVHGKNLAPYSGFGMYCVRCHASTQSPDAQSADDLNNEFTFASLRNIEGFPREPILFRVDDSWRDASDSASESETEANKDPSIEQSVPNALASLFPSYKADSWKQLDWLPNSSYDTVVAHRDMEFASADQCMNCHAGLTGPFGPVGFIHSADEKGYGKPGFNVSPYGEWRWTPMGLAGRDPIFHAQLASELSRNRRQFGNGEDTQKLSQQLVDTCFRCHGAAGHRSFHQRQDTGQLFDRSMVEIAAEASAHRPSDAIHGALARDGVNCVTCHRMSARPQPDSDERPYLSFFLESSITGNFYLDPSRNLFGPYKDDSIAPYAMHHATGWQAKHSEYISQSQMCGSCHTVSLPNVDFPFDPDAEISSDQQQLIASESVPLWKGFHHHIEQATYLEWLNSQYNDEHDPQNPLGQSCQYCHMSDRVFADEIDGPMAGKIRSRIAAIQDVTYPDAENLAKHDSIRIDIRDDYRRHNFAGLNVWLVEMFHQFPEALGIKPTDYMTGSDRGGEQAVKSMLRTARQTAAIEVDAQFYSADTIPGELIPPEHAAPSDLVLDAQVKVTNLTGHRFPTGVGFRRAFIEFKAVEVGDDGEPLRTLWISGRTNDAGVIVGPDQHPLPTEFFDEWSDDPQTIQPHHQVITSQKQVQIYESLLRSNDGRVTTSFIRGCKSIKDNRLLPKGWTAEGPGNGLEGVYLTATHPGETAKLDSDYQVGDGSDTTRYLLSLPSDVDRSRVRVVAELYYQAFPPYYLKQLAEAAPDDPAVHRMVSLVTSMQLDETPIEKWKLRICSARVAPRNSISPESDKPAPLIISSSR